MGYESWEDIYLWIPSDLNAEVDVGGIFNGPGHQENGYSDKIPRTDPALSSLDRLPPSTDNVDGRNRHPRDPEKRQEGAFLALPPPLPIML